MSHSQFGASISQQGFFSASRDSLAKTTQSQMSTTTSEVDLTKRHQRKNRLKGSEQPLLNTTGSTGNQGCSQTQIHASSANHLNSGNSCNGTDR